MACTVYKRFVTWLPRRRILLTVIFLIAAIFLVCQLFHEFHFTSLPVRFVFLKKVSHHEDKLERLSPIRDSRVKTMKDKETRIFYDPKHDAQHKRGVSEGHAILGLRITDLPLDGATPEPFVSAQIDSGNLLRASIEEFQVEAGNETVPGHVRGTWRRKDLEYHSDSNPLRHTIKDGESETGSDVTPGAEEPSGGDVENLLEDFGVVPAVDLKTQKPDPSDVNYINHYWQSVTDTQEIYLYSAYFDDRRILDEPMIRILAVAETSLDLLVCLHWYPRQPNPDVSLASVDLIGPKISPSGGTKYAQWLFSCQVIPGKGPPEHISIVTTANMTPITLLPVQIPERPRRKIDFGHCMSVAYWKHDPYKVVEWLELHRMWGVGEVTVYNNSLDDVTALIFQHYAREGFVDFRQAPNAVEDSNNELSILLNMSPVINDCLYRNMYRYKWVVCTDLDEYIVPRMHRNYGQLLRALIDKSEKKRPAKSYMFNNVYFFNDLGAVRRDPWFLWTQRYLRHVDPSPFGYSSKSISDPRACVGLQNHLCWRRVPRYEEMATAWNVDVNQSLAMNYHYKKCHFDQYEGVFGLCKDAMRLYHVDKTMLRFGTELYDRVTAKLLQMDLIEETGEANLTTSSQS